MKKLLFIVSLAASLLWASCAKEQLADSTMEEETYGDGVIYKDGTTILSLGLPQESKVNVGPAGERQLYWNEGDCLVWNGTASKPLPQNYDGEVKACFTWDGKLATPANLLYPAAFYKDESHISIPQNQGTMQGDDDLALGAFPLYGIIDESLKVTVNPLCAVIRLQIKGKAGVETTVKSVRFSGNNGEQVSGEFGIDYSTGALTAAGADSEADKSAIVECEKTLSSENASYVNIVVPAGKYEKGFTVTIVADSDDETVPSMTQQKSTLSTLKAGQILSFPVVVFEENVAISNAEEFVEFVEGWNAVRHATKEDDVNVVLVNDIEFTDELSARFVATGGLGNRLTEGNNFYNGTFSGRGYSIRNLKSSVPVFGITGGRAVIDGIVLDESCTFTCKADGPADFGTLVGRASGTISNCVSNASVAVETNTMSSIRFIGGLVARNFNGTVSGCTVNGDITFAGGGTHTGNAIYVGGVVGRLDGADNQPGTKLVENSVMNGTLTVDGTLAGQYMFVGGVVGDIKAGKVSGCETGAEAKIICKGTYKNNIGGIVGHVDHDTKNTEIYSALVSGCTNNAAVSFTSSGARANTTPTFVGGIVGQNGVNNDRSGANIENCTNNGKISTNCNSTTIALGGVVGLNYGAMNECTNNADIVRTSALSSAQSNRYMAVGGIVGTHQCGDVSGLVNRGKVESGNPAISTATTLALGGVIGQLTNAPSEGVTVSGCENYGTVYQNITVDNTTVFPINVEGGIIGLLSSPATVSGCYNHGEVYLKYKDSKIVRSMVVGGIVGIIGVYANSVWTGVSNVTLESDTNYGKISNGCWDNSTAMYTSTVNGGIVGIADGAGTLTISNCVNTDENPATVQQIQRGNQGGIVGYARNVSITNCESTKNTDTNRANIPHFCGGIAGQAEAVSFTGCTVRGASLRCKNSAVCSMGGIVGKMDGSSSVASCAVCDIKLSDSALIDDKGNILFFCGAIAGTTATGATINNCKIDGGWSTDSGANYTAFTPDPIASDSNWTGSGNTGGKDYDLTGTVTCGGSPVAGVVVSDGYQSVKTDVNGKYFINTTLNEGVTCVNVSIPSGYMAPFSSGLPQFYKKLSTVSAVNGVRTVDFTLEQLSNPGKFTLIAYADVQIRPHSSGSYAFWDNIAFKSVDVAKDFFHDVDDYADAVSGSNVIGISLGDQVHHNPSMFDTFKGADMLGRLSFPNFCIAGNHDYSATKSATIYDAASNYESNLAPVRYSFNMGAFHVIVMDNTRTWLKDDRTVGLYDANKGLNDDAWKWLQGDLKYVSTGTPLIVCTHSALFMEDYDDTGNVGKEGYNPRERDISTRSWAEHGNDYALLLAKYKKVYALSGHTHSIYNYVYPESNRMKNTEVHILTRCTGDLYTNQFINNCGAPRGYLVFDIDEENCTYTFKPVAYQTAKNANKDGKAPGEMTYRDYSASDGKFKMKAGKSHAGETLDTFYQIHAYAPGASAKYPADVVANIFMYNRLWSGVSFEYDGGSVPMTQIAVSDAVRDIGYTWIHDFYATNYSSSGWPGDAYTNNHCCYNLFHCTPPSGVKSGTVKATDQFGQTYEYKISW